MPSGLVTNQKMDQYKKGNIISMGLKNSFNLAMQFTIDRGFVSNDFNFYCGSTDYIVHACPYILIQL